MDVKLTHVIKYVKNMSEAVAFHRDVLGLPLSFESPGWSEFGTGSVTLALHSASDENRPGTVELGYTVRDLAKVYADREKLGLRFLSPPASEHGALLATFAGSEGESCSAYDASTV
jgi:catechol 2,3-dioxygenase-like lactoylglutathione lyase family enzyme